MAGLAIFDRGTEAGELGIGGEEPGRFHVDDEARVRVARREVAGDEDANLVGIDRPAAVVDHAAAVAVAVEGEADVGAGGRDRLGEGGEHGEVFRVGVVAREGRVELGVERHDRAAERCEDPRRKNPGGAVPGRHHRLDRRGEGRPPGQVGDVTVGEAIDVAVAAAVAETEGAGEDDLLQPGHLRGPEGERPAGPHLDPRPAVLVVRGGDHGDGGEIEGELGEVGHRRQRQTDVADGRARRHQAGDEGELDRRRIRPEVVADGDARREVKLVEEGAEAEAEGGRAHEVELRRHGRARPAEPPAGVVFAEARGADQRHRLEGVGIGGEGRDGPWEGGGDGHGSLLSLRLPAAATACGAVHPPRSWQEIGRRSIGGRHAGRRDRC